MSEVKQVGGDHYSAKGLGHWDLCTLWDVPYLEGNATKYLARYKRKGTPVQDLEKALSYVEKRLESEAWKNLPAEYFSAQDWRRVPEEVVREWILDNDMRLDQAVAIETLLCPTRKSSWVKARNIIFEMIKQVKESQ